MPISEFSRIMMRQKHGLNAHDVGDRASISGGSLNERFFIRGGSLFCDRSACLRAICLRAVRLQSARLIEANSFTLADFFHSPSISFPHMRFACISTDARQGNAF